MFVLDEADEMLSRGFKDQIYEIFQKLSTNIQVSVLERDCASIFPDVTVIHEMFSNPFNVH